MIKEYAEEIINIKLKNNDIIHCVFNKGNEEYRPLIVIPSQYEKTIRTNLMIMLYLINNGFDVLRFDNRYHNGNSTGNILDYKMSTVYEDLEVVLEYIRDSDQFRASRVGVLGISIATRAIYQYLGEHSNPFDVFVSLVGVVNIEATLTSIAGFNGVKQKRDNPKVKLGVRKLLSYEIDWDNFVSDVIENNMEDLYSTKKSIRQADVPIYVIAAEKDAWVDINDVEEVFDGGDNSLCGKYKLQNTGHELYKNPESAKVAMKKIVEVFWDYWKMDNNQIVVPDINELIKANQNERFREKKYKLI